MLLYLMSTASPANSRYGKKIHVLSLVHGHEAELHSSRPSLGRGSKSGFVPYDDLDAGKTSHYQTLSNFAPLPPLLPVLYCLYCLHTSLTIPRDRDTAVLLNKQLGITHLLVLQTGPVNT